MTIRFERTVERAVVALLVTLAAACQQSSATTGPTAPKVSFTIVDGNAQSAPVNTRLPIALRARVTTPTGVPVANFTLNFVVTSGGGSVFGGAEVTNSQGYAEEVWTLGPRLGPQTVEARTVNPATGVAASYGNFTAKGTAPHVLGVAATPIINGGGRATKLETIFADGSGAVPINIGSDTIQAWQLSPDHQHVFFYTDRPAPALGTNVDSQVVYRVAVNGTGLTVVAGWIRDFSPHANSHYPPFNLAPDGQSFAIEYTDPIDGGPSEVSFGGPCDCILPSQPANIPSVVDTFVGSFSPDMTHVVFGAGVDVTGPGLGIWTAPLSGAYASWTHLTTSGANPMWSPDGQHIAFTGANGNTFIMDPDGNNVKQVTTGSGQITWSPDSQLIGVGGALMNLDGTSPVPLPPGFVFAWK
jgi:hypothetical protein